MTTNNTENKELYEAPASVTLSVITPKGYNALFTLRETTGSELLEKITTLEVKLEDLGYKPQIKQTFGKKEVEYVEGKTCPKCGGRLVKKVTSNLKPYHKCENGKWNFQTKQAEGCNFVDWLNPPADKPMTVEEYENYETKN